MTFKCLTLVFPYLHFPTFFITKLTLIGCFCVSVYFIQTDDDKVGTLDAILSTAYCRTQMYLSKQMAQLRPEITMPMFSGKLSLFSLVIDVFAFSTGICNVTGI